MQLSRVEIEAFKRFRERLNLRITGKLTAIVGANEAGKTSLLKALEHLTTLNEFEAGTDGADISRGAAPEAADILVEASFLLEDHDRELLASIEGADRLRWFSVGQRRNGDLVTDATPRISRNLDPRERAWGRLARLAKSRAVKTMQSTVGESEVPELVNRCLAEIATDLETLHSESLDELDELAEMLDRHSSELPKYAKDLPRSLRRLAESERLDPPHQLAAEILWKNSPDFLFYRDEDRTLASAYSLPSVVNEPPASLRNLAQLAGLDLVELERARVASDQGQIETVKERANQRLRQAMTSWGQGDVSVRFRLDGETLRILVATEQSRFWTLEDRSDGLRSFIALRAFLATQADKAIPPILLIDEAEAHLHYDAQADLIQVWTLQQLVPQIVYTTHSAGCLPEDLASVRTVRASGDETSTIDNWFWLGEEPGMASLLLGMGAATMAFVPTRYAVVGEGAADVILLPTLLREASEADSLGFQVVPGGAEVTGAEISILKRQAPRVLWVVDNDEGGRGNATQLRAGGVPEEQILTVCRGPFQTLEDLLGSDIYLKAVNDELHAGGHPVMAATDLTAHGRSASVRLWCDINEMAPISQRAVAHRLLSTSAETDSGLLSDDGKQELVRLLETISNRFGVSGEESS